jgi:hypothetical protein
VYVSMFWVTLGDLLVGYIGIKIIIIIINNKNLTIDKLFIE